MEAKTLIVERRKGNDPTLGKFSDWRVEGTDFACAGVERPWVDADHNGVRDPDVSCIKPGKYVMKWTRSNRLSLNAGHDVFTYEVIGVEGASGIRIHAANWARQLKGCLAPGRSVEMVEDPHTGIRTMGVSMSQSTLSKLETVLGRVDAYLVVVDKYQDYV